METPSEEQPLPALADELALQHEPEQLDLVDRDPRVHRPTEPDEEEVLRALYGEPDADGLYGVPADTEVIG